MSYTYIGNFIRSKSEDEKYAKFFFYNLGIKAIWKNIHYNYMCNDFRNSINKMIFLTFWNNVLYYRCENVTNFAHIGRYNIHRCTWRSVTRFPPLGLSDFLQWSPKRDLSLFIAFARFNAMHIFFFPPIQRRVSVVKTKWPTRNFHLANAIFDNKLHMVH